MVEHRPDQNRFVLTLPEGEARLAYHMRTPTVIDMVSTFVPSSARGRGTAAKLAEAALIYARDRGLQVIPSCWYVEDFIAKHSQFAKLLEAADEHTPDGSAASCGLDG